MRLLLLILASLGSFSLIAEDVSPFYDKIKSTEHGAKSLEIFEQIIAMPTVMGRGQELPMAKYLKSELLAAGFSAEHITIEEHNNAAVFVARYKGDGTGNDKPILLLAHMDVVEALEKDWVRPPFELTMDKDNFYGRGVADNKLGVAMLVSTFIKLKKEGFTPNRDLIIAFTGDEETAQHNTAYLAGWPELTNAEYALNTDAGGGTLAKDGTPLVYGIQSAEKTYATFELTATNPGGHSSAPRVENAIYDLTAAVEKIGQYRFPTRQNSITKQSYAITGKNLGGELGEAMIRFSEDPNDKEAADRLFIEPNYVGGTRTTCVPTKLRGGHAENALPQSATATINCRIFPDVAVDDVKNKLIEIVDNPEIAFVTLDDPKPSLASELREDVEAAVAKAVHSRAPGVTLMPYMSPGTTDALYFRSAGVPTWGIGSTFMYGPSFAHGLNERIPVKSFYEGLNHWEIILKELTSE